MLQKVIIRRATMKGDGAEGNPRGYFQGKFKINGIEKVFTTDYKVLTVDEFEKDKARYGTSIFFKKFMKMGDNVTIVYDDDFPTPMDAQKKNFCTELVKMPEMRTLDEDTNPMKYWTVEFGNEVSVRKASKLVKIIKILNILSGMSHRDMANICWYFAPHYRPDKMLPSDLFLALGDIRSEKGGNPDGVLICNDQRMDAVLDVYYKNAEESQFRTTIFKALEWSIIKSTPKGFYLNDEYIGNDKELVYTWLKNHPQIFQNAVLPLVAQRDVLTMEDDMKKVNAVKYEVKHNVDRANKSIEDLRAEAKTLGIKGAHLAHDKAKIIGKIEAAIAEAQAGNTITLPKELIENEA